MVSGPAPGRPGRSPALAARQRLRALSPSAQDRKAGKSPAPRPTGPGGYKRRARALPSVSHKPTCATIAVRAGPQGRKKPGPTAYGPGGYKRRARALTMVSHKRPCANIAVRAGSQGRKKPGPTANGAGRLQAKGAGTAQRFPQTYVRDYRRPRRTWVFFYRRFPCRFTTPCPAKKKSSSP